MIVRITRGIGEQRIAGNGLLLFAPRVGDKNGQQPKPIIITLWHVVGITQPGPQPLQNCYFYKPGSNLSYPLVQVQDTCPMEFIDGSVASRITPPDGLCLLEPAGFFPTEFQTPQLALPSLNRGFLREQVEICLLRNIGDIPDYMQTLGRPKKNQDFDSYGYPGPAGLLGMGCSGSLVVRRGDVLSPPKWVYGFHCGKDQYHQPPDQYVFVGVEALHGLMIKLGYFHILRARDGWRKEKPGAGPDGDADLDDDGGPDDDDSPGAIAVTPTAPPPPDSLMATLNKQFKGVFRTFLNRLAPEE